MYVDRLRSEFDAIEAVWLLGARANDDGDRDAAWELAIFADEHVLNTLKQQRQAWERPDVSLLVVVDGDRFENPSDAAQQGRLSAMGWELDGADAATYRGPDGGPKRLNALRVR